MKTLVENTYPASELKAERSATTTKFLSLEAFRGLAAVMIVLYHSRFYSTDDYVPFVKHSHIFVDFFFILSGFVMAYSYLGRIGSKMTLKRFFLMRFGRLYPLHLFTLLLWVPFIIVKVIFYEKGIGGTDPSESNNLFTFFSNLFLVQAFDGYQPLSWNFPSWSISAEFYTYILFFLIIYLTTKVLSSTASLMSSIVFITVAAYASIWWLDGKGVELFFLQCIGGFFLGILIFLLYKRANIQALDFRVATILEITVLTFMVYSVIRNQRQGFSDNIFFYICIVSFLCVIYVFVIQETGYISRLLKNPAFQSIGKLSYSIYMVHAIILAGVENVFVYILHFDKSSFDGVNDVIVFSQANIVNAALILIVILFSAATYHFIELPWRARFKKLASK